jgi:hypothetical protein
MHNETTANVTFSCMIEGKTTEKNTKLLNRLVFRRILFDIKTVHNFGRLMGTNT